MPQMWWNCVVPEEGLKRPLPNGNFSLFEGLNTTCRFAQPLIRFGAILSDKNVEGFCKNLQISTIFERRFP